MLVGLNPRGTWRLLQRGGDTLCNAEGMLNSVSSECCRPSAYRSGRTFRTLARCRYNETGSFSSDSRHSGHRPAQPPWTEEPRMVMPVTGNFFLLCFWHAPYSSSVAAVVVDSMWLWYCFRQTLDEGAGTHRCGLAGVATKIDLHPQATATATASQTNLRDDVVARGKVGAAHGARVHRVSSL